MKTFHISPFSLVISLVMLASLLVGSGDGVQAFGERMAAIADLTRAIVIEPRFTFALVNRALVQREHAAALRRGALPDEAGAMAVAATPGPANTL